MRFCTLSVALALCALSTAASADFVARKQVKSGQIQEVGYLTFVRLPRSGCDPGVLPTISKMPEHGSLELRTESRPLRNRNLICNGQPFPSGVAYYTSNKGYVGPDEFVLRAEVANGRVSVPNFFTYQLTVH